MLCLPWQLQMMFSSLFPSWKCVASCSTFFISIYILKFQWLKILLSIWFPLYRTSVSHLSRLGGPRAATSAHESTLCQLLLLWKDTKVWKAKIFQVSLAIYILMNWGVDSGIHSKHNNSKNNYYRVSIFISSFPMCYWILL